MARRSGAEKIGQGPCVLRGGTIFSVGRAVVLVATVALVGPNDSLTSVPEARRIVIVANGTNSIRIFDVDTHRVMRCL